MIVNGLYLLEISQVLNIEMEGLSPEILEEITLTIQINKFSKKLLICIVSFAALIQGADSPWIAVFWWNLASIARRNVK